MAPFYHKGLRFQCTQCGLCCLYSEGVVYLNETETAEIAVYLNIPVSEFQSLYTEIETTTNLRILKSTASGACVFYQEGRCTIYPVRPLQCRTYPFWPENLTSRYQWKQTARECPGIGQGPIISFQTIEHYREQQTTHDQALLKESSLITK